jgi:hypothetical protein
MSNIAGAVPTALRRDVPLQPGHTLIGGGSARGRESPLTGPASLFSIRKASETELQSEGGAAC